MYSRYSLCLMRALRPHGWAKYIATKKVSSVLYTVEEGTEVPSSTVYSTLAQQAGMPP